MTKQWKKFATIGAKAGDNLLDSGGNTLVDSAVKNASIALHADGYLTNIGTSQILSNGKIATADLAGSGKAWANLPASGATVGAVLGTNIYDTNGSTALGTSDIKNSQIALGISGTTLSLTNAGSGVTLAKGNVGLSNVDNTSDATVLAGNLTGTVDGVAVTTVKNGAASGATANQDSTSTIRAGTTAANVGLGNVTNESKATMFAGPTFTGTVAGVTKSHVGLGSVDNNSTATILGGNLTGQVNSVAVATVTSGAAAGATANQDSTATIRNGVTTFSVNKGNYIIWTNISGQLSPSNTTEDWTITWYNGSGTSLGTTVIRASVSSSTSMAAMQTISNGASATISLGGAANSGVTQTTTVTKNSVVCTLQAQCLDGSGWGFK